MWVSTFIDLLIPAESLTGEISRIYLASDRLKKDVGKLTASILMHRLLSSSLNLFGLLIGSTLLLRYNLPYSIGYVIFFISVGTAALIILVLFISLNENLSFKVVQFIFKLSSSIFRGRIKIEKYESSILKGLKSFHYGMETLSGSGKAMIEPIFYGVLAWITELSAIVLVFYSIGYECPFNLILIVYSLIYVLQTVPVGIAGSVGVTEVLMTALLTLLGVPATVSATVVIFARTAIFWFKLIVGFLFFQFSAIKIFKPSRNHTDSNLGG